MKFLSEYRDPDLANRYLEEIKKTVTRPWTIMEVCGGQTHSLVKNGILNMLPKEINMVHGPLSMSNAKSSLETVEMTLTKF